MIAFVTRPLQWNRCVMGDHRAQEVGQLIKGKTRNGEMKLENVWPAYKMIEQNKSG